MKKSTWNGSYLADDYTIFIVRVLSFQVVILNDFSFFTWQFAG